MRWIMPQGTFVCRTRIVSLILIASGAALSSGCATIVPPRQALADPVPVYVADYGIHSSLFLPTADGRFVEYAFGDWGYAAENRCGPQDALGALAVSFQSALGRRYFEPPAGTAEPVPDRKPRQMHKIYCDRESVYALLEQLDHRYDAAMAKCRPVTNPENGVIFVKDDTERYGLLNNCNHLTARSLEALGCKVSGPVVSSRFNLATTASEKKKPIFEDVPDWSTASAN